MLLLTLLYTLALQTGPVKSIDSLVVLKAGRILQAYHRGRLVKAYTIALGGNPVGAKQYESDKRTPEGLYRIDSRNPNSGYHKNLGISYPNQADRARAKKAGRSPGGHVKIHGLRNGLGFLGGLHRWMDWTAGCIGMTDDEVDELYDAVAVGTPILIKP